MRKKVTLDEYFELINQNSSDIERMYDLGIKENTIIALDTNYTDYTQHLKDSGRYTEVNWPFYQDNDTKISIGVVNFLDEDTKDLIPEAQWSDYQMITFLGMPPPMYEKTREVGIRGIKSELERIAAFVKEKGIKAAFIINAPEEVISPIYYP